MASERSGIKCVVWDLDETLWRGTLLEGDAVTLTPGVTEVIRELDDRGILQSIASKNDHDTAWERLVAFGLDRYFLHPQIGWTDKSASIRAIAGALGIGLDTFAFVDDQAFERDEVRDALPEVTTVDAAHIDALLAMPSMQPRFVTHESRLRREMYRADLRRKQSADEFTGTREEFLATLGMEMTIRKATEADLRRAEELTIRTNQLNTTGRTYSYEKLRELLHSPDHLLLVAQLEDRYGPSGTIGLALIERDAGVWLLKLLIMSCRVLSRGVGGVVLTYILQRAQASSARLQAQFVETDRNRMMYLTYKFHGFREVAQQDNEILLEHDLKTVRPFPRFVRLSLPEASAAAAPAPAATLS